MAVVQFGNANQSSEFGVATSRAVTLLGVFNVCDTRVDAEVFGLTDLQAVNNCLRAIVLTDFSDPPPSAAFAATSEQDETSKDHRANGKKIWERLGDRLHRLHQLLSEIGFREKTRFVSGLDLV